MPMPGGYWLWPSRTAVIAASSTSGGPSSSGKPWPRLIEPVATASADISAKIVVPKPCIRSTRYGESDIATVDSASSSRSSEHSSAPSPSLRSTPLRRPAHPSTPPLRLHHYGRLRFVVPLIRALLRSVSSAGHEAQPHLAARVVAVEIDQHHALPGAEQRLAAVHGDHERGRDQRGQDVIGGVSRRPVRVPVPVVAREETFERVDEVVVGTRARLDDRPSRGGVWREHVEQPVAARAAEGTQVVGQVDDAPARGVDVEHRGVHRERAYDGPFTRRPRASRTRWSEAYPTCARSGWAASRSGGSPRTLRAPRPSTA